MAQLPFGPFFSLALFARASCFVSLMLVLKGIHHYWKYIYIYIFVSRGLNQMEVVDRQGRDLRLAERPHCGARQLPGAVQIA